MTKKHQAQPHHDHHSFTHSFIVKTETKGEPSLKLKLEFERQSNSNHNHIHSHTHSHWSQCVSVYIVGLFFSLTSHKLNAITRLKYQYHHVSCDTFRLTNLSILKFQQLECQCSLVSSAGKRSNVTRSSPYRHDRSTMIPSQKVLEGKPRSSPDPLNSG